MYARAEENPSKKATGRQGYRIGYSPALVPKSVLCFIKFQIEIFIKSTIEKNKIYCLIIFAVSIFPFCRTLTM